MARNRQPKASATLLRFSRRQASRYGPSPGGSSSPPSVQTDERVGWDLGAGDGAHGAGVSLTRRRRPGTHSAPGRLTAIYFNCSELKSLPSSGLNATLPKSILLDRNSGEDR